MSHLSALASVSGTTYNSRIPQGRSLFLAKIQIIAEIYERLRKINVFRPAKRPVATIAHIHAHTPLRKQRPRTCIRPPLTVKNAPCAPSLARKQRHLTQRNRFCHSAFFLNFVELPQRRYFRTKNFYAKIRQYKVCKRNRLTPTALHPTPTYMCNKNGQKQHGKPQEQP